MALLRLSSRQSNAYKTCPLRDKPRLSRQTIHRGSAEGILDLSFLSLKFPRVSVFCLLEKSVAQNSSSFRCCSSQPESPAHKKPSSMSPAQTSWTKAKYTVNWTALP